MLVQELKKRISLSREGKKREIMNVTETLLSPDIRLIFFLCGKRFEIIVPSVIYVVRELHSTSEKFHAHIKF